MMQKFLVQYVTHVEQVFIVEAEDEHEAEVTLWDNRASLDFDLSKGWELAELDDEWPNAYDRADDADPADFRQDEIPG